MADAERNQHVRLEIAVHVRVQVGAEFAVIEEIGLHDRLRHAEAVIPRLAHQHLRDRGNRGLHLHAAVREDVRDLRVAHAEDIKPPVLPVHIAGNLAADDLESGFIEGERQLAELRQIRDQVAAVVVRRAQAVAKTLALHRELHHDVLFLVQIKLTESLHARTFLRRSFS